MNLRWSAVIALCFALCSAIAVGQLPTATVSGVVRDDSGAAVAGAEVTIKNVQTNQSRSVTTNDTGSYSLAALAVGNYEARVTKQGFEASVLRGITLTVSQEATMNVTLKLGVVEQEVTVSGGIQSVNTESATLGGVVDEQKMLNLPLNGRNFVQLALNETGVVQNTNYTPSAGLDGTMITVNGASMRSNMFLLDGAPMQNAFGANSASVDGPNLSC